MKNIDAEELLKRANQYYEDFGADGPIQSRQVKALAYALVDMIAKANWPDPDEPQTSQMHTAQASHKL